MGSKGSSPATTNTSQTQSYSANPVIARAGKKAINMATSAADQPFQMPVAPVAGFNPFQQQAFGQVQNMQGQWAPDIAEARRLYTGSGAAITGEDVNQYYNPMAQNVFAQLANQQQQQMHDVTGRLTGAAGGVGAERIALGQSKLANQQNLAYGDIAAKLWQQALGGAQQQKQMMAGAAGGLLGTAGAGQTAALRDVAAMGQAGLQQQQQSQAELNAPYQNTLARIAYPFQTAQYLAGITGGLAPAFGGTSSGTSTTTQTPAQPSALNQAIGLGTSALGMFMGMPPGMAAAGGGMMGSLFGGGTGYMHSPGGYSGAFPMPFAEGGVAGSPLWETTKGPVPSIKMQPGSGPKPMTISHQQTMGQDTGNTAATASKAMDQIGGMLKASGDDYEPDMADGGAVFPKHFYNGGNVWEDLSVSPGRPGIPGIDFALPRSNDGNVYMESAKPAPDMADWGGSPQVAPPPQAVESAAQSLQPQPPSQETVFPSPSGQPLTRSLGSQPAAEIAPPTPPAPPRNPVLGTRTMPGAQPVTAIANEGASVTPYAKAPPWAPESMTNEWVAPPETPAAASGFPDWGDRGPRIWPKTPAAEIAAGTPPVSASGIPLPTARPEAAGPSGSTVERMYKAIVGNEGNVPFDKFHPNPDRKGNYAIGPAGIMDFNVPSWTKEALGKAMTVPEFMASPEAQERTAKFKLEQYLRETGDPVRAADKWFTGIANPSPDRNDGLNNVAWYRENFIKRFYGSEDGPSGPTKVAALSDTRRQSPNDQGRYSLPTSRQPYPDALHRDWGQQMTRSPWMSLVKAGSTIASTPGPLGVAIAKGIGAGADQLTGERGIRQKEEGINQRAQQLHQQAQHYLDQFDKMTPYQRESLQQRDDALAKTIYPGKGMVDGQTVDGYYQYNPATQEYNFRPGQITGRSGSGSAGRPTALITNAEWLVSNGIVADREQAFNKLKEIKADPTKRARLLLDIEKAIAEREPLIGRQPEELKRRSQEKLKEFMDAGAVAAAPAGGAALPMPASEAEAVNGQLYNTPRGPAIWDAATKKFKPVTGAQP